MEWLRWKIIEWLNRYVDTCWADLVNWAVYSQDHLFVEVFSLRGSARACFHCGDVYCGKCLQIRPFGPYWETT